jgi:hypothetical protein
MQVTYPDMCAPDRALERTLAALARSPAGNIR